MSEDKEFTAKLELLARQGVEYSKTAEKLDPNDPVIARLVARGIKLHEESRIALQEAGKDQLICLRCESTHVNNETDCRRTGWFPYPPYWPKEGDLFTCSVCREWLHFTGDRLRIVTPDVFKTLSKKKRKRIRLLDRIHRELTALNLGEISKVTATYATDLEGSG